MMDVVFDTIIDSIKLLPFLFLTYLAMEYLEHKTSARTKKFVKDSGKAGPVIDFTWSCSTVWLFYSGI
ncbi:MAG: hypothetical protein ACLTKH_05150 [Eubacterium sp.]